MARIIVFGKFLRRKAKKIKGKVMEYRLELIAKNNVLWQRLCSNEQDLRDTIIEGLAKGFSSEQLENQIKLYFNVQFSKLKINQYNKIGLLKIEFIS